MAKRKNSKRNRKSSVRKPNQGQPASPPVGRAAAKQEAAELVGLGNARLDTGDYEEAITYYELAIAADRNTALGYYNRDNVAAAYRSRGDTRTLEGNHDGAREDYQRANKLSPSATVQPTRNITQRLAQLEAALLIETGDAKLAANDYDGAICDYEGAASLDREIVLAYGRINWAKAHNNRGNAKAHQGDYDSAVINYDRAIDLEPKFTLALNYRGNAKVHQGDYDGAIADCDLAVRLDPNLAIAFNTRGTAKGNQGNQAGAIADYDQAVKLNPNLTLAYINRGNAKAQQEDFHGGVADYDEAIERDTEYVAAYMYRGLANYELGNYDGAIADFDQAISLNAGTPLNSDELRIFYEVRGNVARAAERSMVQSEMDQLLEMSEEEREQQKRRAEAAEDERNRLRERIEQLTKALDNKERIPEGASLHLVPTRVQYYVDGQGGEPYTDWLSALDRTANQRVRDVITQMRRGNLGDYKPLQNCPGIFERRLDSGLRIYFAKLSPTSCLILHGGDKSDQQRDIETAAERLADWRARHPK